VAVAVFFLSTLITVGGFRGGLIVGAVALFSAIGGGATGVVLRLHRDHWWALEERAENAIATREIEATRRVTEERLRIARDLHDVIGHQVAMLSMHLGAAEIGLPDDARSSRQALVAARACARTVLLESQRILALLRRGDDRPDDGLGLVGMRERVEASHGRLTIGSDGGRFRVSAEFSLRGDVV
jgi:signal transduction histidine kinase